MWRDRLSILWQVCKRMRWRQLGLLTLLLGGLLGLGGGLVFLHQLTVATAAICIAIPPSPSPSETTRQITIDIQGAVQQPGVYHVLSTARMQDGIQAAGGFSDKADTSYVARQLNLSTSLQDEEKIYIPFAAEVTAAPEHTVSSANDLPLVSINTADAVALDALPGVGAKRAEQIISNRPYQSIEDLVTKKILSTAVFADIKQLISL